MRLSASSAAARHLTPRSLATLLAQGDSDAELGGGADRTRARGARFDGRGPHQRGLLRRAWCLPRERSRVTSGECCRSSTCRSARARTGECWPCSPTSGLSATTESSPAPAPMWGPAPAPRVETPSLNQRSGHGKQCSTSPGGRRPDRRTPRAGARVGDPLDPRFDPRLGSAGRRAVGSAFPSQSPPSSSGSRPVVRSQVDRRWPRSRS